MDKDQNNSNLNSVSQESNNVVSVENQSDFKIAKGTNSIFDSTENNVALQFYPKNINNGNNSNDNTMKFENDIQADPHKMKLLENLKSSDVDHNLQALSPSSNLQNQDKHLNSQIRKFKQNIMVIEEQEMSENNYQELPNQHYQANEISQNLDDSLSNLRDVPVKKDQSKTINSRTQKKYNEIEQGGFLNSAAPQRGKLNFQLNQSQSSKEDVKQKIIKTQEHSLEHLQSHKKVRIDLEIENIGFRNEMQSSVTLRSSFEDSFKDQQSIQVKENESFRSELSSNHNIILSPKSQSRNKKKSTITVIKYEVNNKDTFKIEKIQVDNPNYFEIQNKVSLKFQKNQQSSIMLPIKLKTFSDQFLNNIVVQILIILVTLYSIFSDDFRIVFVKKENDFIFMDLNIITLVIFALEVLFSVIGQTDYLYSFFFWVDSVCTLSMITDFQPILIQLQNQWQMQLADAIRVVRLVRILKLYKSANNALARQHEQRHHEEMKKFLRQMQDLNADNKKILTNSGKNVLNQNVKLDNFEDVHFIAENNESVVGKALSEKTTKKVIVIVFILLFSLPLLKRDSYVPNSNSLMFGLDLMYSLGANQTNLVKNIFNQTVQMQTKIDTPLIYLKIDDGINVPMIWQNNQVNIGDLRNIEIIQVFQQDALSNNLTYAAVYSQRNIIYMKSIQGIAASFLVCFIIGIGALKFTIIARELVIKPIEDMIKKINNIAINPLEAAHHEEDKQLLLDIAQKDAAQVDLQKKFQCFESNQKDKDGPMETVALESILGKIGGLLALGLGEAGSEIIAQNMSQNSGDINPMLPGVKLISIFGFCDIRNFTDATEVLQEGVMLFVNEIGEICHGTVNRYQGAANKNIGDAFLLVWKLEKEDQVEDENGELKALDCVRVNQLADMSAISFLLLIAGLKKSRKMQKYNQHKELNKRMPNYEVKLGSGLHMGYAIEGAIGSYYKIDASYLSPNVNMAARLEGATKTYGVPLLITGSLFKYFTKETKMQCRQVDWVTMQGNDKPVELYTIDVEPKNIRLEDELQYLTLKERKIQKLKARMMRKNLRNAAFNGDFQTSSLFQNDEDIKLMREPFTQEFLDKYRESFKLYIEGKWTEAKIGFESVIDIYPEDPLSTKLINYMKISNFQPKKDWKGYKFLKE